MSDTQKNNSTQSLLKILYLRWKLILILAILGILIGTTLSIFSNKTTYSASKSVMLVTKDISSSNIDLDNAVTGDLIADVFEQIKSEKYVKYANEIITSGPTISKGAISISRSNDYTFIFTITYRAASPEVAEAGLNKIIDFSSERVFKKQTINSIDGDYLNFFEFHTAANNIKIKPVQYNAIIGEQNNLAKNIILTVFFSLVLSFGLALVFGLLDNTIVDKDELEEITGTNLLSFIEDTDKTTKKEKNKK